MSNLIYAIPVLGIIGLLVMIIKRRWVNKQDAGDQKMQDLANYIREGALAFLSAEYRVLSIFVVVAGALLGVISMVVETTHILDTDTRETAGLTQHWVSKVTEYKMIQITEDNPVKVGWIYTDKTHQFVAP